MGKKNTGGAKAPVKLGGEAPKKGASSVDVIDVNGVIRTYSKKEHGADFRTLADEFASKAEGRKVVASKGAEEEVAE